MPLRIDQQLPIQIPVPAFNVSLYTIEPIAL